MDYIYKVTGKKVTLADGRKANVAVYAYKPFYGCRSAEEQDRLNNKMYYSSGAYAADRYAEKNPNFTGLVVMNTDENTRFIKTTKGSFTDSWFDSQFELQHRDAA